MSDTVIKVENLSKRYVLSHLPEDGTGLRHAIERIVRSPLKALRSGLRSRGTREEFWALRELNLEIKRGEVVGIIGRNGAGKSTLLKILSRITEPTEGRIYLRGRTASLLEVGTGFHPELTGRENIVLNGAILGMTRAEIKAKFDEIVAFAEVEQFIDTPVKRYSSGMYVRLAFAVAAHLEPDILVVDEVLAVGDAQFQKKCLGKMQDVARQQGRTVLFVSHNMQAVASLTTRCVLLQNGRSVLEGPSEEVIAGYLQQGFTRERVFSAPASPRTPAITRVQVETSGAHSTQTHGMPMRLIFDLTTPVAIPCAWFSFQIVDSYLQPIVDMRLSDAYRSFCVVPGTYRLICEIPAIRLYLGRYAVKAHLYDGHTERHLLSTEPVCPFEVVMGTEYRGWPWAEGVSKYLEEGRWHVVPHLDGQPSLQLEVQAYEA